MDKFKVTHWNFGFYGNKGNDFLSMWIHYGQDEINNFDAKTISGIRDIVMPFIREKHLDFTGCGKKEFETIFKNKLPTFK